MLLLTLDFEKLYDIYLKLFFSGYNVEGFWPRMDGLKLMGYIRNWIKSTKTLLLFNGDIGNKIKYHQGLWQGDPLSSLLLAFDNKWFKHSIKRALQGIDWKLQVAYQQNPNYSIFNLQMRHFSLENEMLHKYGCLVDYVLL